LEHPIIHTENVTKYYGDHLGVKDISFQVNKGEIFGFLGPNGAGKTTTIRMLLDMLRPSSGEIRIFDKEIKANSFEIRQKCGYLPGNFAAYGNLNGKEFLSLCTNLRNIKKDVDQHLFDRFELYETDLSKKIKHLSHGMLQKLGIIQAFFHKPELLILDEPTIGLDPLMQEEFYRLLLEFQQNGSTVFFSSHNLAEVEKVCHRVAIIRKGELVREETIESLKRQLNRKLILTFEKIPDNLNLPGIELLNQKGQTCEYVVKGDLKSIMKMLSDLLIADIVFPEPDLEDVFINFYKDQKDE